MAGGSDEERRADFRLRPEEDFLFGVRLSDGELRFGPAGSALLYASVSLAGTVLVCLVAWLVPNDKVDSRHGFELPLFRITSTVVVAFACWHLVARLRSGVTVTIQGVTIRRLSRSDTYEWSRVSGTRIINNDPPPAFGWHIGAGAAGGGVRVDVESCKAYLVLDDSSEIPLYGFESAARQSSGLPASLSTPTELKLQALRRFRAELVGPWRWGNPDG